MDMKMAVMDDLNARSGGLCEICGAAGPLDLIAVAPREDAVLLCSLCQGGAEPDSPHWRCLSTAVWSQVPAVKVLVWRKLSALDESWATETLDTLYPDPELQDWAQAGQGAAGVVHRDANGAVLAAGDTVVLIKDLPVKGAGFTAKRGTAVRGIVLVAENAGHIEGRVEGQRIVILTEFVRKK